MHLGLDGGREEGGSCWKGRRHEEEVAVLCACKCDEHCFIDYIGDIDFVY